MSSNDFVIKNGVLKRYTGKDSVVTIPEGVTSIENKAFSNCTSLKSIAISNSVKSIGKWAFSGCSNLTSITIPNGVTSIGACAFYNCYKLASITIPDSVTEIGYGTFENCTSLASITIPDSVTEIGWGAFDRCISLVSIIIPNGVTEIGWGAFDRCISLISIIIPNGVTSIGEATFRECTSLESVTIPNSVTSIDVGVFEYTPNLRDIYYKGSKAEWDKITVEDDSFESNVTIHYNSSYSDDIKLLKIEEEVIRLLSEGKSEKEVYSTLKNKNIPTNDILDAFSKVKPSSEIIFSFCDRVVVPNILSILKKNNGISKYNVGEVADILYKKYPENLVNKAIISVLREQYLVD